MEPRTERVVLILADISVFHEIGRFSEVSGLDVILAHRLLKNSIPSDEYVLMTESAYRDIEFPAELEVTRGEEHYDGLGAIRTYTYLTPGASAPEAAAVERLYAGRGRAFATGLRMLAKGHLGQIPILLALRPAGHYADLDELRVLALMPLVIPFGVGVQAYRALTRRTLAERRSRA